VVTWLLGGYAVLFAALISCAAYVALFVRDKQRRADAYRVLKLILGTATGTGTMAAALVRLHDAGFL
jgi:hypothetical protein